MFVWTKYILAIAIILLNIRPINASELDAVKRILSLQHYAMTTQQIARASCYIGTSTDVEVNLSTLNFARDDLEKFGMRIDDLDVIPDWEYARLGVALTLDMPSNPGLDVELIAHTNAKLLKQADEMIEASLKQKDAGSAFVHTVEQAARIGILSQKLAKEFCYISYGIQIEQNKAGLRESVQRLEQTIRNLLEGNLSNKILAAPTNEIRLNLVQMRAQWALVRQAILDAANGKTAQSRDFSVVSGISEPMLEDSLYLVDLYLDAYEDFKAKSEPKK